MGLPKGEVAPTLTEWVKLPWEKKVSTPITDNERNELLDEMAAMNAALAQAQEEKKDESE